MVGVVLGPWPLDPEVHVDAEEVLVVTIGVRVRPRGENYRAGVLRVAAVQPIEKVEVAATLGVQRLISHLLQHGFVGIVFDVELTYLFMLSVTPLHQPPFFWLFRSLAKFAR